MTDDKFDELIIGIVSSYKGDGSKLLTALGALTLGRYYGWTVLSFVTSEVTFLKYQKVLGIKFKDVLPKETEYSERSFAFRTVKKLGNFWKVVQGKSKMPTREKFLIDNG